MNKAQALDIAITAMFREILREDDKPNPWGADPDFKVKPVAPDSGMPQPRFDFVDDDFCEHGGLRIPRQQCPVHNDEAQAPVTDGELDDITTETPEEANPMIARARRLAAERVDQQRSERLFPEDIPMAGAGPPPDIPPNLVV